MSVTSCSLPHMGRSVTLKKLNEGQWIMDCLMRATYDSFCCAESLTHPMAGGPLGVRIDNGVRTCKQIGVRSACFAVHCSRPKTSKQIHTTSQRTEEGSRKARKVRTLSREFVWYLPEKSERSPSGHVRFFAQRRNPTRIENGSKTDRKRIENGSKTDREGVCDLFRVSQIAHVRFFARVWKSPTARRRWLT